MRSRLLLLIIAALLAFAAWWLLGERARDDTPDLASARKERADAGGAKLPSDAPTLKGNVPFVPLSSRPRFTLTVRVTGLAEGEAALTTVVLRPLTQDMRTGPPWMKLDLDASGTAVADVSEIAQRTEVLSLQMRADSPAYVVATAHVALPETAARATGLELDVEIPMTRAAALVGRVVDEMGRPMTEAQVDVDHPGGVRKKGREELQYDAAAPDNEGRFRLRIEPGPEVVVLAWAAGRVPVASAIVATRADTTVDVGTLRLVPGTAWEGRVRGVVLPTNVRAVLLGPREASAVPDGAWWHGQPVQMWITAPVAKDESFALAPVVPGWWRIRLPTFEEKDAATPDLLRARDRIAHTRDGSLQLDSSRALLIVRVTRAGESVYGAHVVVTGTEALAFRTGGAGIPGIGVRPSTSYAIRAFAKGALSRTVMYTSPPAGQEATLDLALETAEKDLPAELVWADAAPLAGAIALEVVAPDGDAAPASIRITDASGNAVPTAWVERGMITRWRTEDRLLGRSPAVLITPLPAGEYTLRIALDGCRPLERPLHVDGTFEQDLWVQLEPE